MKLFWELSEIMRAHKTESTMLDTQKPLDDLRSCILTVIDYTELRSGPFPAKMLTAPHSSQIVIYTYSDGLTQRSSMSPFLKDVVLFLIALQLKGVISSWHR